ncbi:hypothetical protein KVR01_009634 [Diaporthe batatas]|uniref:uncharacterized protein n=1 Tax=Diaporthe batatas TaxID=748121 RepID=UPI001D03FC3D|nr:uncharacterized protein KVR01_009634 [Diaporthe batatas]KAG8161370.1 hypothetical protein KVR01_009634 [Diaporthe batatas]
MCSIHPSGAKNLPTFQVPPGQLSVLSLYNDRLLSRHVGRNSQPNTPNFLKVYAIIPQTMPFQFQCIIQRKNAEATEDPGRTVNVTENEVNITENNKTIFINYFKAWVTSAYVVPGVVSIHRSKDDGETGSRIPADEPIEELEFSITENEVLYVLYDEDTRGPRGFGPGKRTGSSNACDDAKAFGEGGTGTGGRLDSKGKSTGGHGIGGALYSQTGSGKEGIGSGGTVASKDGKVGSGSGGKVDLRPAS